MFEMKLGDCVTIKYLSAYKDTRITFLKITKIGHKYIYGTALWSDDDGKLQERHKGLKYDMNNSVIYSGIRRDLKEMRDKYDSDYRIWKNKRSEREREVDWEIKDFKFDKMDEWKKDNPMPQLPEFPTPNS